MIRLHMNPDRVDWCLPMGSLIPEESMSCLKEMFGESTFSALGKEEVLALVTADAETCVDNLGMRQITGRHAADVTRLQDIIDHLTANGWLLGESSEYDPKRALHTEDLAGCRSITNRRPYKEEKNDTRHSWAAVDVQGGIK